MQVTQWHGNPLLLRDSGLPQVGLVCMIYSEVLVKALEPWVLQARMQNWPGDLERQRDLLPG